MTEKDQTTRQKNNTQVNKEKRTTLISCVLLIICLGMFIAGCLNGEKDLVLAKSRNICIECIGIW